MLGEWMAKTRTDREVTGASLAAVLGVTRAAVSTWERGRSLPSAERLASWGEALGVSAAVVNVGQELLRLELEQQRRRP